MNKLQINGTYIEIQCDRNDTASQELAMKIPYVHCNRIKTKYTTSTCNIDLVLKLFRGIDAHSVDKLPPVIRSIYDTEMKRRIAAKTLLELGPVGDRGFLYAPNTSVFDCVETTPVLPCLFLSSTFSFVSSLLRTTSMVILSPGR